MNGSARLLILALAATITVMCAAAGPSAAPTSDAAASNPASPVAAASSAAAAAGGTPGSAPASTACPNPARRAAAAPSPQSGSVAPFAGENGASKVFAFVESVDVAGQRVTLTFPNSSTGGLATPAAALSRVTVRVTSASVLQQIVAYEIPLTAPVAVASTKLAIADGAPAQPARAPVVVIGLDACGAITSTVRTTLTQAVAAGSHEWTIATPLGTLLPQGAVISSALVPLPLADLKEGDMLLGPGGALIFGLVFSGRAPDYVEDHHLFDLRQRLSRDPAQPGGAWPDRALDEESGGGGAAWPLLHLHLPGVTATYVGRALRALPRGWRGALVRDHGLEVRLRRWRS